MTRTDLDAIVADALADRYGLLDADLARVQGGQNTINLSAHSEGRRVFVKTYAPGTDLDTEQRAIGLSERAGTHRVPVAPLVRNGHGQRIDTAGPVAFSVWEWMPGQVVTDLDETRYAQAGQALGRIHTAFADLSVPSDAHASAIRTWRTVDVPALHATIDRLMAVIDTPQGREKDPFDEVAARTLSERRTMLDHLPILAKQVGKELTVQVLHGDYSPVNLLYANDGALSAVLDFTPPRPNLLAYDLGRMAFYPHSVTGGRDWLTLARVFIGAYLQANPRIRGEDVRACARIALIQLLRSLYGVKQHYLEPGIDQDALDAFWVLRHQAARTLVDHQEEIAHMLDDLAHDL